MQVPVHPHLFYWVLTLPTSHHLPDFLPTNFSLQPHMQRKKSYIGLISSHILWAQIPVRNSLYTTARGSVPSNKLLIILASVFHSGFNLNIIWEVFPNTVIQNVPLLIPLVICHFLILLISFQALIYTCFIKLLCCLFPSFLSMLYRRWSYVSPLTHFISKVCYNSWNTANVHEVFFYT